MNDLIDRQAAINALDDEITITGKSNAYAVMDYVKRAKRKLENLPSAQSDCKKGNWIYGEDEYGIDGYHCDKCGFFVPWDYAHKFISYIEDYNFCPSCGADMRGSNNEYEKIIGV